MHRPVGVARQPSRRIASHDLPAFTANLVGPLAGAPREPTEKRTTKGDEPSPSPLLRQARARIPVAVVVNDAIARTQHLCSIVAYWHCASRSTYLPSFSDSERR
jgi:hypothetical protein